MVFLNINNKSIVYFCFILIIGSISSTISKKFRLGYYLEKIIKTNPLVQLAVFYLLFFISFDIISENYLKKILFKDQFYIVTIIFFYYVFIFTNNTMETTLIAISIILIYFINYFLGKYYKTRPDNEKKLNNKINQKIIQTYSIISSILIILFIVINILGLLLNIRKKKIKYSNNFSWYRFFILKD